MHAHENYKTYGTVEDGIEWEIAEQPLLEQLPPPSMQPTSHRQLGRLLSVACGMYRYAFFIGGCRLRWVVASSACIRCTCSLLVFSLLFLFYSLISIPFYSILLYSSLVWAVACGMYRYVCYGCVSIASETASEAHPRVAAHNYHSIRFHFLC